MGAVAKFGLESAFHPTAAAFDAGYLTSGPSSHFVRYSIYSINSGAVLLWRRSFVVRKCLY